MKKTLFMLFVLCVISHSPTWASDIANGKGYGNGAYFSTDFGEVTAFGDFGGSAFRSNGGGPEKSGHEYNSGYIGFMYLNPATGKFNFLSFHDTNIPDSMYISKNRKHASLSFYNCNIDGYCAEVEVNLLGWGDLISEPFKDVHIYDCREYRFLSTYPYRLAKGVVSFTVWDPAGVLMFEGAEPTVNATINRGMYTTHEAPIQDCDG